jgi:hypothetical protein
MLGILSFGIWFAPDFWMRAISIISVASYLVYIRFLAELQALIIAWVGRRHGDGFCFHQLARRERSLEILSGVAYD